MIILTFRAKVIPENCRELLQSLTDYLAAGERKIDLWFKQHDFAIRVLHIENSVTDIIHSFSDA